MSTTTYNRYILNKENSDRAIEQGLAEADWYTCPVPKEEMRKLLKRRNGPALRDTIIWFGLLAISGYAGFLLWGTWWAIIPFFIYGIIYGTTSDSRWHESSHGTAFASDWLNNVLYEISSFMVMRESTVWRWSHTRHHSDTIIAGRDPEIVVPRPPDLKPFMLAFLGWEGAKGYFKSIFLHATGRLNSEEEMFIPESARGAVFFKARIYLLIYVGVIGAAIYSRSFLPLMFVGLPNFYGAWLMPIYGFTQHVGLAENVLDHRLNCRTVRMNLINRYLYWNMNFHVEHHMFPLVPYHNLPRLHELVKSDMPKPYSSIFDAWREIIPAVLRQLDDPVYFVKRKVPTPTVPRDAPATAQAFKGAGEAIDGWMEICESSLLEEEDVIRFDHQDRTYAIYRTAEGELYATDGVCTHGNTHLADGLVKGKLIECPKHNGRFDITDGSPKRAPVCVALKTYKVREQDGKISIDLTSAGGCGADRVETTWKLRVVSNENVATFIKELVLEAAPEAALPPYQPGDYLQLNIPAYGEMSFDEISVSAPFDEVWKVQHLFEFRSENKTPIRRNYSLASNPSSDQQLRFNVRIATPPRGQDCLAGAGSAYVHGLKAGDEVTAIGPFGDFHVKPGDREMIYIGGGAGMAPLRSHLSHLFDTLKTNRKVSFWYGARSKQELFYQNYFEALGERFPNFSYHPALSEPLPEENWNGSVGFIHNVLSDEYLKGHPSVSDIDYYLCGPPMMIQAAKEMLGERQVRPDKISFDEF